jgi:hypothetical protein
MIIWRGAGVSVSATVFLCSLAANGLAILLGGNGYWEAHGWPLGSALIVAGVVIWLIDARLAARGDRVLLDEQTGERVVLPAKHDFFFLPMKFWSVVCACVGVGILVTDFAPGAY